MKQVPSARDGTSLAGLTVCGSRSNLLGRAGTPPSSGERWVNRLKKTERSTRPKLCVPVHGSCTFRLCTPRTTAARRRGDHTLPQSVHARTALAAVCHSSVFEETTRLPLDS